MAKKKYYLTELHRMLIQEKNEKLQHAIVRLEHRKEEFKKAVQLIANELKIPDKEIWELSEDFKYFEKVKSKKNDDSS